MRLEGYGTIGAKGVIWEALPAFDFLLTKCENQVHALINRLNAPGHPDYIQYLLICYQNAWEKLKKYNDLTDTHYELYAAATLLNPCLKKRYFVDRWTGKAAGYIEEMVEKNRSVWEEKYKEDTPNLAPTEIRSSFEAFLCTSSHSRRHESDEFTAYLEAPDIAPRDWSKDSLFDWWQHQPYPSLRQWAFDTLSIPATSAEIERVFSQARRIITDDRNSLSIENLEILLCFKHWMNHGLLNGLPNGA
jgi:hypothetical protein